MQREPGLGAQEPGSKGAIMGPFLLLQIRDQCVIL